MHTSRVSKLLFLCFLLIISLFVTSCGPRLKSEQEANDYIEATRYQDSGRRLTFTGSVTNLGSFSLTLTPDAGSGITGGSEVRVAVSGSDPVLDEAGNRIALSDLSIGDRVRITYDGQFFGSDPVRISQCYEVQKLG